MKKCSFEGCEKKYQGLGYCQAHRLQFKKGKPLTSLEFRKPRGEIKECSFIDCDKIAQSKGLCNGHLGQVRRGKQLSELKSCGEDPKKRNEFGEKRCRRCKDWKDISEYYPSRGKQSDGLNYECIRCNKSRKLIYAYGITIDRYEEILALQGGHCAVCPRTENESGKAFAVDHDHSCCPGNRTCGKCIRGILCARCNVGIGMLNDSANTLIDAANYLMQFKNILN